VLVLLTEMQTGGQRCASLDDVRTFVESLSGKQASNGLTVDCDVKFRVTFNFVCTHLNHANLSLFHSFSCAGSNAPRSAVALINKPQRWRQFQQSSCVEVEEEKEID
jgi:hypothetical protein